MKVKVKNRSDSFIGFGIPDMHIRREFAPNEVKEIDVTEIEKVAYQPGGQELLDEYFMILDDAIANKISPNTSSEPEYKYTEENIKELLTSGSYDAFLDFLDFAPQGAIDIVKNLAIKYATDTKKIEAIHKATGFNVINAQQLSQDNEDEKKTETRQRRVSKEVEPKTPTYQRV